VAEVAQARGGLRLENVSKTFPAQRALDGVDLAIGQGEICGLVGANGSGKSTLIKILAGYHQPDPGARASIGGRDLELGSHAAAAAAGVRFVHQDLGLIGTMTVAENLTLDEASGAAWWVRTRRDAARVRELLDEFDLDLDPTQLVDTLSAAERTLLAVVRAIRDGVQRLGILVLDEPTGTLSTDETVQLFEFLRRLRDRGASVLFVTHRLEEVFEIADRVTVLRDGRRVFDAATEDLDQDELVEAMVGRPLEAFYPSPPPVNREILFEVDAVCGPNVDALSFTVHSGEIVGFAGLTGSGRETLAALVSGVVPWSSGEVRIAGEPHTRLDPAAAIARGVAYVPSDRKALGSISDFTVRENLTLPRIPARRSRWLSLRSERAEAATWLSRLKVKPSEPDAGFATLSGGNQQRVILARWLRCGSRVFVLDEPTQGVDVAGKADIYEALTDAARAGAAIAIASTDADELAATCDRVLVLRSGQIRAELFGDALTSHAISHHEHGG
jgi:ribose transport system ATP-binding protein